MILFEMYILSESLLLLQELCVLKLSLREVKGQWQKQVYRSWRCQHNYATFSKRTEPIKHMLYDTTKYMHQIVPHNGKDNTNVFYCQHEDYSHHFSSSSVSGQFIFLLNQLESTCFVYVVLGKKKSCANKWQHFVHGFGGFFHNHSLGFFHFGNSWH